MVCQARPVAGFRYSDDIAWVGDDERVAALRLSGVDPRPRLLTDSAATIWNLVGETQDLPGLVAAVAHTYDVEPGAIGDDVRDFVAELVAEGLLIETGTPVTDEPIAH